MTIAFEIGVGNLFSELLAHTLIVFGTLPAARTIPARSFKSLADGFYYLFVFVKSDHSIII